MNLKEKIQTLPHSPGVYLMKDSKGNIIYVGKSKNLKNRVSSYFYHSKNHSKKVERLVKNIKDIEIKLTDTEFEAFLLECQLIKTIQPPYNRQMKNFQTYAYIVIGQDKQYPTLEVTNIINPGDGNVYYGPYQNRNRVEEAVLLLKEFYKIDCNHPFQKKSYCLNYSLGKCMGICMASPLIMDIYEQAINELQKFLGGENVDLLHVLEESMQRAAMNVEFEKAAKIKEKIQAIQFLVHKEKVLEFTKENHNIIMIEPLESNLIKLFLIKGNKVIYSKNYKVEPLHKQSFYKEVSHLVEFYFHINKNNSIDFINKKDVDEAQIIYRYLNTESCSYLIIPEAWLEDNEKKEFHSELDQLLEEVMT